MLMERLCDILKEKGYIFQYGARHIDIEFEKMSVRFVDHITYIRIYVFDLNNRITQHKDFRYPKAAVNYMIKL